MLKLGNLILNVPFFQAPLSGYSDYAMRRLGLDFGAPLTFAGVMLAKSAAHPKVLRKSAFRPHDDEHPVGAQILGTDPETMAKAARALQEIGYDIIDLNFACPAPKVLRRQRGGYLLNDPETVMRIYDRVRDAVTCPVTMKLRTGYDSSEQSSDSFHRIVAEAAERNIDALTIHGRTVLQKFGGDADWDILAEIKKRFAETTIIGSGDLFDPQTIVQRLKTSNIDGVLIARGAVGNPWIYEGLHAALKGEPAPPKPSIAEQAEVIVKHFERICQLHEPTRAVKYFRKFLVQYCRLHPSRRQVHRALIAANDKPEFLAAMKECYGN